MPEASRTSGCCLVSVARAVREACVAKNSMGEAGLARPAEQMVKAEKASAVTAEELRLQREKACLVVSLQMLTVVDPWDTLQTTHLASNLCTHA